MAEKVPSSLRIFDAYLRVAVAPAVVDPQNIKPGPLNLDKQQAGGISLVKMGDPLRHPNLPVVTQQLLVKCFHQDPVRADDIGNHIDAIADKKNRIVVTVHASDEIPEDETHSYLVQSLAKAGGLGQRREINDVWSDSRFITITYGTEPII